MKEKTLGQVLSESDLAEMVPNRNIHTGWVHCSASDRVEHDSVLVMDRWHRERGWTGVGYHAFIRKDGAIEMGRSWDRESAAQAGHNAGGLAVCLHGLAVELFTPEQEVALMTFWMNIDNALASCGRPTLRWRGHCEVSAKDCPVIDYRRVLWLDGDSETTKEQRPAWFPLSYRVHTNGTLRIFDRGDDVKALQSTLAGWGFFLVVDGLFGRATDAAVRQFQKSMGLDVDGIVGPLTGAALRKETI